MVVTGRGVGTKGDARGLRRRPRARRRGPLGEEARKESLEPRRSPGNHGPNIGACRIDPASISRPVAQLSRARRASSPGSIPRNPARAVSPVSEDPVDESFLRALV